jgi:polyhydroxyalkanoate synthesis regulator phasin
MPKDTVEYQTLVRATSELKKAVKNNITPLCDELVSNGLITTDNKKALRNPNPPVGERASDLVELITDKVEQNPANYQVFINILKEDPSTYKDILEVLDIIAPPTTSTSHVQFPGMLFN